MKKPIIVTVNRGDPFMIHTKDSDCTLDEHDCCKVCFVGHGEPCSECDQKAFHLSGCKLSDASDMERALATFLDAGQRLVEAWDDTKVTHYPKYLPSFDEFMADFTSLTEVEEAHPLGVCAYCAIPFEKDSNIERASELLKGYQGKPIHVECLEDWLCVEEDKKIEEKLNKEASDAIFKKQ